ncbi:hypothetical protein J3A83DRAFT_2907738 [Scleroderma citrinum]
MNSTSAAPNAHEVMQAPLIGSFFNLLFYGVSCVQTFLYYQTYPDDNISLKLLVAVIWILETVQSGSTISFNNTYLIQGFALAYISWDLVVACEVGVAVVLGTTATILAFIYNTWEAFEPHAFAILAATMSLAVVEDTLIALILTYYLYNLWLQICAARHSFIGIYCGNSMGALMELVALSASPHNLLYLSIILVQVKVYANSALLSLNLRQYQRKSRHPTVARIPFCDHSKILQDITQPQTPVSIGH